MFKFFFYWFLFTSVDCRYCSDENVLNFFKFPTYDFSIRILDRVAEESGYHFVFSPLSTWIQLIMLAEGTTGSTRKEILQVTRHNRMKCFRDKYLNILNAMDQELSSVSNRSSVIIVNSLLDVDSEFHDIFKHLNNAKVLSLDFGDAETAATAANSEIALNTGGVITEAIYIDVFNLAMLLMTDTAYFKSEWKVPFNPVYTTKEPFYYNNNVYEVSMMTQHGYYNVTEVPGIDARVLELPLSTDRVTMIIALPTKSPVKDIFFKLQYYGIRIRSIFSLFKKTGLQPAVVKLPKFKIKTDVDNIPELLYDMGVRKIFYPELADFSSISNFKMHVSFMNQVADIEITETGVEANVAEFLIHSNINVQEFTVNRPFAYFIVDKTTELIIFAGIYSDPSI